MTAIPIVKKIQFIRPGVLGNVSKSAKAALMPIDRQKTLKHVITQTQTEPGYPSTVAARYRGKSKANPEAGSIILGRVEDSLPLPARPSLKGTDRHVSIASCRSKLSQL